MKNYLFLIVLFLIFSCDNRILPKAPKVQEKKTLLVNSSIDSDYIVKNNKISFSLDKDSLKQLRVLEIYIRDSNSNSVIFSKTFLPQELSFNKNVDVFIDKDMKNGIYEAEFYLNYKIYNKIEKKIFFVYDKDIKIKYLSSLSNNFKRSKLALFKSKIDFEDKEKLFYRWKLESKTLASGILEKHVSNFKLRLPNRIGDYTLYFEVFPFPPPREGFYKNFNSTIKSKLNISVVNKSNSVYEYFFSSKTNLTLDDNFKTSSKKLLNSGKMGNLDFYSLNKFILPIDSRGIIMPFDLTLNFLIDNYQNSSNLFFTESLDRKSSFRLYFTSPEILVVEIKNNFSNYKKRIKLKLTPKEYTKLSVILFKNSKKESQLILVLNDKIISKNYIDFPLSNDKVFQENVAGNTFIGKTANFSGIIGNFDSIKISGFRKDSVLPVLKKDIYGDDSYIFDNNFKNLEFSNSISFDDGVVINPGEWLSFPRYFMKDKKIFLDLLFDKDSQYKKTIFYMSFESSTGEKTPELKILSNGDIFWNDKKLGFDSKDKNDFRFSIEYKNNMLLLSSKKYQVQVPLVDFDLDYFKLKLAQDSHADFYTKLDELYIYKDKY